MVKEDFWYGLVFGMGFFVLGTIILVVILTQVGAFTRARIARREEAADQEMIKRYETLATTSNNAHESAAADIADVRTRLESIERMLREVD